MPLPKDFVNYARAYPMMLEGLFAKETDRLQRSPEAQQWFAQNMPNATAQERATRIQQQAAMNAQQLGQRAFAEAKQKHGVKQFTPQDLHEAINGEANDRANRLANDPVVMRAANGADMAKMEDQYRNQIVPDTVNRELAGLSRYLPFDVQEEAKTKPVSKGRDASKGAEGGAVKAGPAPADDPVLRGVVGIMQDPAKAAEEQRKKQQATTGQPPQPQG